MDHTKILKEVESSPEFVKVAKGKKVVASTVVRYKEKPEGADSEHELVETLHFDYDDGKTIRTAYDLSSKKVVKIDLLEAYPTPLAPEEVKAAKTLAKEKDPRAKELARKYTEKELEIQTLSPVVADKKSKLYGKRLAIVILRPKAKLAETVSVKVNLTDNTLVKD
jgi:hypothetical protein